MANEAADAAVALARSSGRGGVLYEFIIGAIYRRILEPGDLVLDGGAHKGVHTWPLSTLVGPTGRVVAVEPIPELADALRSAREPGVFENVVVLQCALSNETGRRSFSVADGAKAYSGLQPRETPAGLEVERRAIEVSLATIDGVVDLQEKPLRFLKLDLEGGEHHALLGAERRLTSDRPIVAFENGRSQAAALYGYDAEDFFALFERCGYRVFDIVGRPFDRQSWSAAAVPHYAVASPIGHASDAALVDAFPELLEASVAAFRAHIAFPAAYIPDLVNASQALEKSDPALSERVLELAATHQPEPWLTRRLEAMRQKRADR